jgi:hypothetical protein
MVSSFVTFVRGATAMGCAVAALFFLRFWRTSLDRLFLWFAIAFVLLACSYTALALLTAATDWRGAVFGIRLVAFCVILFGIFEKNRPRG